MSLLKKLVRNIYSPVTGRLKEILGNQKKLQTLHQKQLMAGYRAVAYSDKKPNQLYEMGFSVYSENGEDGILLYILSLIGAEMQTCVEIGCGYGRECNTANLLIHHGWKGLLIDASSRKKKSARAFYRSEIKKEANRPAIHTEHVTKSNINRIMENHGFTGTIDLLSIDIDGVDYWI